MKLTDEQIKEIKKEEFETYFPNGMEIAGRTTDGGKMLTPEIANVYLQYEHAWTTRVMLLETERAWHDYKNSDEGKKEMNNVRKVSAE